MADQKNQKSSPEVSSESVKTVKKIRKEAKKAALLTLKECVDKIKDQKYIDALKTIRPSLYGGVERSGRVSNPIYQQVVVAISETGKNGMSETILFTTFKIGRKETNGLIKKHLRKSEPANRVWISFNKEKGLYNVVGTGSKPPAGYMGYVPIDESVNLK